MPGSIENALPATTSPLPSTMYGSSCPSMPIPCPVRWMNPLAKPASWISAGGPVELFSGHPGLHCGERGALRDFERHVELTKLQPRLAEHGDRPRSVSEQ